MASISLSEYINWEIGLENRILGITTEQDKESQEPFQVGLP